MNLHDAIRAGAARVDGRGAARMLHRRRAGVFACAIGAAYLGCHPDASPRLQAGETSEHTVWEWAQAQFKLEERWYLITANDRLPSDAGWDQLLDALPDELLDLEVCSGQGA